MLYFMPKKYMCMHYKYLPAINMLNVALEGSRVRGWQPNENPIAEVPEAQADKAVKSGRVLGSAIVKNILLHQWNSSEFVQGNFRSCYVAVLCAAQF